MTAHATETQPLAPRRTGPVGRAVRVLLAVGFAAALATFVDQGGPASIGDPENLTDAPFLVLTIAMVAVYTILVAELATLGGGQAVAKTARSIALAVLAAATAAAVVGEARGTSLLRATVGSPR
jgi:hypothetical protein